MTSTYNWKVREREYVAEKKQKALPREETTSHPLKGITVTVTDAKSRKLGKGSRSSSISSLHSATVVDPLKPSLDVSDPLSMFAAQASESKAAALDPLSKMANDPLSMMANDPMAKAAADLQGTRNSPMTVTTEEESPEGLDPSFVTWSARKTAILSKYTTSEKLSITTSFLSADKERGGSKAQSSTVSDKVKNRLEQLDDFEEGSVQEMLNLSQQEYVKRIDDLNNALTNAWEVDQRVRALKIAIQCSKLLADVSVIQFYPSKFVLITDILDTFGRLVYDRIKTKAMYIPKGSARPVQLPDNFTPEQVPDSAKETCKNWFFKIASIRELIPRFYVEAAIIKCYGFLTSSEYNQALHRLGLMTRGMGDPLVALYARCYLCRVGIQVAPATRDHLMPSFDDFLFSYKQIQTDHVQDILAVQKLDLPRYLTLYSPGLDWVLACIAHDATDATLERVLDKCSSQCNSALLLNSILLAFKSEYISSRATQITGMIKDCEETGFPKHLLYRALGSCLVTSDPPEEDKLPLLNDVWKVVVKLKNPTDYISCAEVWIEYVVKNFSKREVNTILNDIIKHMTPDRAYEDHYSHLQTIITRVLQHITDFSLLFSLEKFLPFLDMFQKESIKVEVCKSIMETYCKHQTEETSDPVIINALMFICKTMHDSVNALSLEDDLRHTSQLITAFLRTVSFGRDFEQQLSFYVEARASFSNLDTVIVFLVQCVNTLAIQTRKIVNGNHSRKTAAFVRACAAYTYITIPSLYGIFTRLNLYLISGEVALTNLCLSQADAFFKAAIALIPEIPKTLDIDGKVRNTEPLMCEFVNNLISTLLIVPDNPDQGVLYLIRGLLNVIADFSFDKSSDAKVAIYMNMIVVLSAMSQERYAYSIDKVDSNDKLYGHDPKFVSECLQLCDTLLQDVLQHLQGLDALQSRRRQAVLAHDLFSRMVAHADLSHDQMFTVARQLWVLSQKHGQLDTKLSVKTLTMVKVKGQKSAALKQLAEGMSLQSTA